MWQQSLSSFGCTFLSIIVLTIVFSTSLAAAAAAESQELKCPIDSIYQLGDSLSDTGNLQQLLPDQLVTHPHCGATFPGYPAGRWSDGRLMIDYIAMALGLPPLNPYMAKNSTFQNRVNFAVAGSTALSPSFRSSIGTLIEPDPSLVTQLNWLAKYLRTICLSTPTDCRVKLSRSLVIMGEIGYNDMLYPFVQGRPMHFIQNYLPLINGIVVNSTREVINSGARQVMLPGLLPFGCMPSVLLAAASQNKTETYDDKGCLESMNTAIISHNKDLQEALGGLRQEFPNATILYADLYKAFESLLVDAPALGFKNETLLKPCCGDGYRYPITPTICGYENVSMCPNPDEYISWDGIHLTQQAYSYMAKTIIRDLKINCNQ